LRVLALATVFGLVAAIGLSSGPATAKTKRPKLGKEGMYSQVFKNKPGMWQDDTSITAFVKNRKIVAIWITSDYRTGGKVCAPGGLTPTLMPDKTLTGPVWVTFHPKKPIQLNGKNKFSIKTADRYPFYEDGGGSIKGRLLQNGKLSITASLAQAANSFQGRCSTKITAPKMKFKAMKVSDEIANPR
jgi:hypothetical protein